MIRVAILTVSDSAAAGSRIDSSGPALAQKCSDIGWQVVEACVVPDERTIIALQLQAWSDRSAVSLILTTGGTGVALRDVTPEATRDVVEREVPGIAELIRSRGMDQTRFSVLSRGMAGTRKRALIVNLPGSPRGAVHSLDTIAYLIPHAIELLEGRTDHPSNEKLNL